VKDEFKFREPKITIYSFRGGTDQGVEYQKKTRQGILAINLRENPDNGRIVHGFKLNPPDKPHAVDVEFNIPLQFNRRASGCFAEDGSNILMCNRGKFTPKTKRNEALKFFKDHLISVQDGDKETQLIRIASISSPSFAEDIAEFTKRVKVLKSTFK
jgi:hypothetical protein